MRFSTHIKFHCQFLCRIPWKGSFLEINPRKYARCIGVQYRCTKQGSNNGPWAWLRYLWLTNHHIHHAVTWRDLDQGARTDTGEALKVLLSVAPLRIIGGQRRFRYKNNLPGLEGQWVPGLEHIRWLIAPPQVHAADRTKKFCLF